MGMTQKLKFNLHNGNIHHPCSQKKKKQDKCAAKLVMLAVFFNSCGRVYHEYAPEGHTINKNYYLNRMCHLHNAVQFNNWLVKKWLKL